VLNLIVTETNRQAQRYKTQWTKTDSIEIKKFLAIVMYTGMISYPKLSDYWSHQPFFQNSFVPKIMPRNRFQELLRFFHVSNNDINPTDRLGKIQPLIDILVNLFKQCKVPAENVVIDETLIPFRGRIIFRQYIPNKAAKYGIKLYKLCDSVGYTYDLSVYSGKNLNNVDTNIPYAGKVVMSLLENYLNEGRTLIVDNFYTSIHIAHVLLDHNTHIVGTLRKNVKNCPKDIMNAKLQRGDIVGKENVHGVVVSKWKDKREVRFLSTRHGVDIINTGKKNRKGEDIKKPEAVIFYNKNKQGIDLSDQMSSYFSPLRKTIRWYHKLAFQLLLGTAVTNALVLYKETTHKQIQISEFRQELIKELLDNTIQSSPSSSSKKHKLVCETETTNNRKKRRRCNKCYVNLSKEFGRVHAQKKCKQVSTYCVTCESKPFFCIECFQNFHSK